MVLLLFLKKYFTYLILERGDGREKERERNIDVWLPLMHPLTGTWPTAQACALTGNRTTDPLVRRLALNPLSHTSQGWFWIITEILCYRYRVWQRSFLDIATPFSPQKTMFCSTGMLGTASRNSFHFLPHRDQHKMDLCLFVISWVMNGPDNGRDVLA